jgi:hypothetical protein
MMLITVISQSADQLIYNIPCSIPHPALLFPFWYYGWNYIVFYPRWKHEIVSISGYP